MVMRSLRLVALAIVTVALLLFVIDLGWSSVREFSPKPNDSLRSAPPADLFKRAPRTAWV
jgi:hypothetical protein